MTIEWIQLPEVKDRGKASGIRGLIQIAEGVRDGGSPIEAKIEVLTRYFSKFQWRMEEKEKNPITEEEETKIREKLFSIIKVS